MNETHRTPSSAGLRAATPPAGAAALRCAARSPADIHRFHPPAATRKPRRTFSNSPPGGADGRIHGADVRHRPPGPVEPERVKTQPFEDDLVLLRQDSSSFEYWGGRGGGGSDVLGGAFAPYF